MRIYHNADIMTSEKRQYHRSYDTSTVLGRAVLLTDNTANSAAAKIGCAASSLTKPLRKDPKILKKLQAFVRREDIDSDLLMRIILGDQNGE
jgi:hypothetical protein